MIPTGRDRPLTASVYGNGQLTTDKRQQVKQKLKYEERIFCLALLAGLPGVLVALWLLWWVPAAKSSFESAPALRLPSQPGIQTPRYSTSTQATLTILMLVAWAACAYAVRVKVRFPLQTLSNLLAAIREGDYSIRARGAQHDDALGEVMVELNCLGQNLREQRLGALEATALLSKVMSEIDVAVFTFDAAQKLRLVNRAGERLLAQPVERLLGRTAPDLALAECLQGEPA